MSGLLLFDIDTLEIWQYKHEFYSRLQFILVGLASEAIQNLVTTSCTFSSNQSHSGKFDMIRRTGHHKLLSSRRQADDSSISTDNPFQEWSIKPKHTRIRLMRLNLPIDHPTKIGTMQRRDSHAKIQELKVISQN
ncbi:hypothetical protein SS50377_22546 [Spironucleus salmonicida]|uniref:Uncharacterized protein n=1 Tax=Spironucleus salmonicida TaxID=348837 RepID=V6LBX7_9EUKA|nr:hypothetical protein SS50377_22546 [Spironucleus salmonicida]|eukprot:EST41962.1 Hypothetical protein SS50377_18267 [Spironucleus salmonicida]